MTRPYTTIRRRLYQLVAIVVLPFAAYISITLYQESRSLIADTQQANRVLAEMTAANLKNSLDEVALLATELAKRPELARPGTPECNRLLADFKQLHIGFSGAGYTDAEGILRCSSTAENAPAKPIVLTDTEWFQRLKAEKRAVISKPYLGRILNTWVVVVAAPVLDAAGNLRGTVNLPLSLERLGSALGGIRLPEHAFITVLDNEGTIVTRSADVQKWLGKNLKGTGLVDIAFRDGNGVGRGQSASGIDTAIGFAVVPDADWHVIVGARAAQVLAPAYEQILISAAIGGVLVLSVLFFALRFANTLIRPMRDLSDKTSALTHGESDTKVLVPATAPAEIADLALHFNAMVDARLAIEKNLITARNDAEQANRAKSEFLANMSHEIRTPMNAIIGLSDLALGTELPPKLRDYFAKIHSSAKALLAIINDILDYSKVEAGRLDIDSVEFSLEEVLENVANLFIVRAEQKGLELLFQIGHDVPPELIGDPLRLSQVMNNLVGNAVKFTEQGQVHIQVETVTAEPGQASLRFAVRDSGIGMSAEQTGHLFQAFTQADGSITRKFGGTGLGLTISKRLVELMGGEILVDSSVGAGSTFTFTLSFQVPQHTRLSRSPTDLRGMRVLVVDDLEISRRILSELLTQWGFEVSEAANGKAALALLEHSSAAAGQIELVLLDWKMPEMDGIEVARRVHELASTQDIPRLPVIIMVTAYSKEQLLAAAQDVQLDAVLTKPVTASGLFDTIIRFQGGASALPTEAYLPDPRTQLAAIQGAHILLVEDNAINQQVAREFLERAGLKVTVAENGVEALAALDYQDFDAVLMDLQMPVMDGLEATRRIRAQERFRDLPIIAMTAAVMAQDRAACQSAGMNDHVAKPILPDEVRAALLKHIKPRPQATPTIAVPSLFASDLPDELPGFAWHDVLETLSGNRGLLRKLLLQFAAQFADAAVRVGGLLRAGKHQEAGEYLHQIKGAAANLGAVNLRHSSAALKEQIKTGQAPSGEAAFDQALAEALTAIATLDRRSSEVCAHVATAEECANCQWQRAEALARELRRLIAGNDIVPQELMEEFKAVLGCQMNRQKLAQLQRQVDSFDYAGALVLLGRLRQEVEAHRDHLEELVAARTTALSIAKEAAEAANRAKSTFLANMSHELRTPMNGIMGMIDLALRRATDPKQQAQLTTAKHSSQRLLSIINDILDISKIEAERLTLEQSRFTFGLVLENLMSLLGPKIAEKGLKTVIDLAPDLARLTLRGDPLRLGQILLNLTGNAVKFTAQGAITLRIRLIEDTRDAVRLRCEVSDTGIGIDAAAQKRLFTAFEQADGSMTRKYGGTRLGLAISKRLVNMMGGEIGVESTVGQGSTFWFTVRLGKADTRQP